MRNALWAAALVLGAMTAACHETDHLGGWFAFRVDVDADWGSRVAGEPITLTVAVRDGTGALSRRSRGVLLELVGPGGNIGSVGFVAPLVVAVPEEGTATVDVAPLRAGRFRLRATGPDATPWLSPRFTVTPAEPAAVQFVSGPRDAWEDDPQSVQVEVLDAYGNRVVEGAPTLVRLADGEGALIDEAPSIAGLATLDPVVLPVGTSVVTANAAGLEADQAEVTSGGVMVGGVAQYERVPVKFDDAFGASALDYEQIRQEPIAGATVQLVAGTTVLRTSTTGEDGSYRLAVPSDAASGQPLTVRVLAESRRPRLQVADNTAGGRVFALESEPFEPGANVVFVDLLASSGWTGSGYQERAAAPFALMDTVRRASWSLVPQWLDSLPRLTIFWSEGNRPVSGDEADGAIGTSHFQVDKDALYVLGAEDEDTDEYDTAVVVHEWGHFLFARGLGRSDTIGGTHGAGYVLDARTAYEEGVCNVLGAITGLAGGNYYSDTSGPLQGRGWLEKLDENLAYDPIPGWYSEGSVQTLVFDLFDAANDAAEDFDNVSYGAAGTLELLVETLDQGNYATVFTLLQAAETLHAEDSAALRALADWHLIDPDDSGGWEANLPLFRAIPAEGGSASLQLEAAVEGSARDWGARASANRWVSFVGDGRTWEVRTASEQDVDLYVSENGWPLLETRSASGYETLIVTTRPGALYVANVRSWEEGDFRFGATLEARPQGAPLKKQPPAWARPLLHGASPSPRRRALVKRFRGNVRVMRSSAR